MTVPLALTLAWNARNRYLDHSDVRVPGALLLSSMNPKALPDYPVDALAAGEQGVVVVDIRVAANGAVRQLRLLEAPSGRIGRHVTAELQRRTFPILGLSNGDRFVASKVILYFVITPEKQGQVLRGSEMAELRRKIKGSFPAPAGLR